ncbi:MAG TPA: hypothetical protein VGL13_07405, partial [Polyangiaceae bacterium]
MSIAERRGFPVIGIAPMVLAGVLALAACSSNDEPITGDDTADATDAPSDGGRADAHDGEASVRDVPAEGAADGSADPSIDAPIDASTDASEVGSPDAGPDVLEASPMDASNPCGAPGILHTPPNVPASIATPPGLTLVAGFRGNGNQVYACVASDTSGTQGTWTNAALATLYGDNCAPAVTHNDVQGNPLWTSLEDGSSVTGRRDGVYLPPAGDAGPTSIP